MKISIYLIIVLAFINLSCVTLSLEKKEYHNILREIRTENTDFAFMKLMNYLREYPESMHTPQIRFAIAEYYFQIRNYNGAIKEITSYITDYPQDQSSIFAYMILYKIILEYRGQPALLERLKERFFAKSLFLIFSDAKVKSYKSILNNTYKIAEYVDKIEIFKNDELFLKITP